ncbi:ATP-binding cassette domain-containing protein, partial [uncultured Lactobacillus sp.]|uniref:ATP-binding cassette domain-containing protein n=1 Tax=uncultured Lactobacillus sp. TaxID=153152 RepID=UPI0025FA2DD9
ESGSGKSTLLKILAGRLTDYTGDLQLDKTEIKNINNSTLRSNVVYIDQTAYLFNDTVRYNLQLGQHFTDEEIESALEKADLWNFVNNLPRKLDTQVGEGGASLSGGQKQRLALARGLLRKRKLFLLDNLQAAWTKQEPLKLKMTF